MNGICPVCNKISDSSFKMIFPFCSYACIDKLLEEDFKTLIKIRGKLALHYIGNCIVCHKKIYTANIRKYCSKDCERTHLINTSRRESIPQKNRLSILKKYKYKCFYCGEEASCIDHIIPVSKGGRTTENNLIAACFFCNMAAFDRLFSSVIEKRKYIIHKRGLDISTIDVIKQNEVYRPSWHAKVYAGKK